MAIFKCKMCGGDLNVTEETKIIECDYCGTTQTVPAANNEKKVNLFNRATRLRINGEFDKAAGIYENIIAEFPEEAEAYWGLCLCNYGIEYVDDPATAKKIPTCHRSSFESIMDDGDFEQVMECADAVSRKVYREEAKAIEELRKGIIEVSANEKPYDIFICYKETAENGDRTLDSVIAQDVYDELTAKGYRVFFSRISLEDKLGVQYEPYIFAALNSAKIMLVFGTDYEYFNAVWVKNEWSRYLKLMASDKTKHLIPCFKGVDAYDMPKEFAKLQAQDMGKIGAIQDLLRGIQKIIVPESIPAAPVYAEHHTETPNPNTKQLILKGGIMYEGEVFANIPHGFGKSIYTDAVYEGEWKNGKRNGQGKLIWNEGGEWIGEFRDNKRWNGSGVVRYTDSVYEGQLKDGKRNGQGKIIWNQGGEWVGESRDGEFWNGSGVVYKKIDNDFLLRYEGEYLNGNYNGYGKIVYTDCVYEGQFKDGKRNGQGKQTWTIGDGGEFTGEFLNDKIWNGKGVVYTTVSDSGFKNRYNGEYFHGERNGYGKMVYSDSVYEGQWKNNRRNGQGKIIWNQGGEWVGEFRDSKPWNGNGVYFVNGERYDGPIENGQRIGKIFGIKFRY